VVPPKIVTKSSDAQGAPRRENWERAAQDTARFIRLRESMAGLHTQ
jgi:hypothetical protein